MTKSMTVYQVIPTLLVAICFIGLQNNTTEGLPFDCQGKKLPFKNAKKILRNVLNNHMVIESYPDTASLSDIETSIKPTEECTFQFDYSDRDDERMPRIIPQAICPIGKCLLTCKKITVKKAVLHRKCHSELGLVYTFQFIDVTIGFIRQRLLL